MPKNVTIDRTPGQPPRRVDKRDLAEVLRDALDGYLGPKQLRKGPKGQTVDEIVDEAVRGAKGAHPDY